MNQESLKKIAKNMNISIFNEKDDYFCAEGINGNVSLIKNIQDLKQHIIMMGKDTLKIEIKNLLSITNHN